MQKRVLIFGALFWLGCFQSQNIYVNPIADSFTLFDHNNRDQYEAKIAAEPEAEQGAPLLAWKLMSKHPSFAKRLMSIGAAVWNTSLPELLYILYYWHTKGRVGI